MMLESWFAAVLAAALLSIPCTAAAGSYAIKATHRIDGEGGWDYLTYDAASNRLFIARASRVQVVNPDTGQVLAEIADTPGVHGVALAAELGKGYVSNGRDNSVTVFDSKTLQTVGKVKTPAGENPDFIAYDAVSRRVFAFNGRSHNVSVIDAATDRLVATTALHGKPEAAVADGRGHVFVDIEDMNEMAVMDALGAKVDANWPLHGCDEPAGLAIDAQTRRLFVGCHNKTMVVVNADSGAIVATLPIGEGVDANAFDTTTQQIFSSQGDGTLTIIKEEAGDKFSVQQTATTQPGARTMALNPKTHEVYLVSADFDEAPAAAGQQRPRRTMKPGSFTLLVLGPKAE